jgi:hypothetical protein
MDRTSFSCVLSLQKTSGQQDNWPVIDMAPRRAQRNDREKGQTFWAVMRGNLEKVKETDGRRRLARQFPQRGFCENYCYIFPWRW